MLNAVTSAALDRINVRAADALGAYRSGFQPLARDSAGSAASTIEPSVNPLDVVAPEGTYFLVGETNGERSYSRDGSLAIRDGILQDAGGRPVLGFSGNGRTPQALRVDSVDRALDRVRKIRIDADGSLVYTRSSVDPRTGERRDARVVVGRLALGRFPAGTLPARLDSTRVAAPSGIVPHIGYPEDGNFPALRVQARDLGRVDMLSALERLQDAYDSFEAIAAAERAERGLDKTSMELVK
ncbi:MAG TPA: hypothetical protein VGZ00_06395 [Candidatus Baltobacteraceae bacterium]|jgi:flagellar basal body rod protein FlgG|nr:hypothetical protein [Candidatus Baltobacteraceae bacterium]